MTRISNKLAYPLDITITDEDYVIGSDADTLGKETKNYQIGALREYINSGLSPELGGTLKFREITYTGVLETPSEVVNSLVPDVAILQYEVVIVSVNGDKYLLKLQNLSVGAGQTAITDSDFIKINVNRSLGEGIKVYKGFNASTGNHEFHSISSPDFNIEIVDGEIVLTNPSTSSIPALYVNNLYEPTYDDWVKAGGNLVTNPTFDYKGDGTFSKPFTDTVRYTSTTLKTTTANTSIQNALDAYVGTGTRLAPQKTGQQIVIEDNNTSYDYSGDFGYSNLNIKISANITSTNTGYVLDMDNASHFNSSQDLARIEVMDNYTLTIQGQGFKNNGTTTATNNFVLRRQCVLNGNGIIDFVGSDISKYLLSSDKDSVGNGTTGFNNDGIWQFEVRCYLRSEFQGLMAVGGKSYILNLGSTCQTGTVLSDVNINLKAFYQKGGNISFRENSSVIMYGSNTTTRLKGFVFEPTNGFTTKFDQDNCSMVGTVATLYSKENTQDVLFIVSQSGSGLNMFTTNVFYSPNVWDITFRNNIFASGTVDFSMVDLTLSNGISVVNYIGSNIIESLRVYASKEAAVTAVLPKGAVFMKRVTVAAGSFVVGEEYRIATIGTTDYTLIGASANTVGLYFTATGVGTGTGTAYLETRETLN